MLPRADHGFATVAPARVAAVPHAIVLGWMKEHEALGRVLLPDLLIGGPCSGIGC